MKPIIYSHEVFLFTHLFPGYYMSHVEFSNKASCSFRKAWKIYLL